MNKVLCFGDSNVYGFIPQNGKRYDENARWSGILQKLCGDDFVVIEAGCNNRTAFCDNPAGTMYTGYKILPEYLTKDIAFVILAIGINDLQKIYNTNEVDIKSGIRKLIEIIKEFSPNAQIILLSPSVLTENVLKSEMFSQLFDETSIKKSFLLSNIYGNLAVQNNCKFLDLNTCVNVSDVDGLHYEKKEHETIAYKVYNLMKRY